MRTTSLTASLREKVSVFFQPGYFPANANDFGLSGSVIIGNVLVMFAFIWFWHEHFLHFYPVIQIGDIQNSSQAAKFTDSIEPSELNSKDTIRSLHINYRL
ncbi:MAG: hypothetical protein IPN72_20660 [Saprospiraceae bacterium]|nr:hypothetical protein [Saprospiraceae bacterium]